MGRSGPDWHFRLPLQKPSQRAPLTLGRCAGIESTDAAATWVCRVRGQSDLVARRENGRGIRLGVGSRPTTPPARYAANLETRSPHQNVPAVESSGPLQKGIYD